MTVEQAIEVRGHEQPDTADLVDKRFARFGLHPLTDEEVWALSMACMVMPDGNPGAEGYLAKIAGVRIFDARLTIWGRVVAVGIAGAAYRAKNGVRRRAYVEGYDEAWGRHAVADALSLVTQGDAPGIAERCETLGCGKQGYQRIRDFVGGALVNAIAEYRTALEWALGYRRDRVFEGRWEGVTGLKWDAARQHEMMGREGKIYFPLFAPGCAHVGGVQDADDRLKPRAPGVEPKDPETLYRGMRPTDWWDATYAARMRVECPAVTIYPATD